MRLLRRLGKDCPADFDAAWATANRLLLLALKKASARTACPPRVVPMLPSARAHRGRQAHRRLSPVAPQRTQTIGDGPMFEALAGAACRGRYKDARSHGRGAAHACCADF
jgi:hypothetical protein